MADINHIRALAQAGWSQRRIARELGHDRATIKKYIEDPPKQEPNPPPDSEPTAESKPATLIARKSRSVCEPFRSQIEALLEKGLTAKRIFRELCDDHDFKHSYPSVGRFVRNLKASQPKRIWRMECEPGEEAQVDFGVARTLREADGKLRYSNVLRVTLSHSRKGYTETVPSQSTECFIRALENAFRHFGGVPATLRIDNLKAAVKKADWYDPELNPKIVDFAQHYRTAIIPTRPYTPQHKGKVESDVSYVKSSALQGREFGSITDQNAYLKQWEGNVADLRIHGTTRKQVSAHFAEHEKQALRPLPQALFPCYQESTRKVQRDGFVEVKRAYYEVPLEYIGHQVWVRWDSKMLHVLEPRTMRTIISHVRLEPGKFSRCLGARGRRKDSLHHTSYYWIGRAALLGQSAEKWATATARNRPDHCIRVLQGLLSLHDPGKHYRANIDRACELALASGDYTLAAIKHNLSVLESDPASALKQGQLDLLLEEHPIIRPLSQYQDILDTCEFNPHQ